ncbi:MAG: tetratricopeptide repeat protein [Leptospiraceae bacterium]|nr:tetratricopeptide repeat protein [Leptospiraceae bacterium]
MILFLSFCGTEEIRETPVQKDSKAIEKDDRLKKIEDLTKKIENEKNNADFYHERGNLKSDNQDFKGAIEDITKAISINPKNANAYYNRALAKRSLENRKEAIDDLNKAIMINSEDSDFYVLRGDVEGDLEDHKGAIEDYSKAIKLNPNNADTYNSRGNAKYNLKKYKEATEDYSQCISLNPKDENAFENRGNSKVLSGDFKGAKEDFEIALKNGSIKQEEFDEKINWVNSTQDIDSIAKAAKIKVDEIIDLRDSSRQKYFDLSWFNFKENPDIANYKDYSENEFKYQEDKKNFQDYRKYKYAITSDFHIGEYDFQRKAFPIRSHFTYLETNGPNGILAILEVKDPIENSDTINSKSLFSISPNKAEKFKNTENRDKKIINLVKISPAYYTTTGRCKNPPYGGGWEGVINYCKKKFEYKQFKYKYILNETVKYRIIYDGEVYKNY